MLFSFELTVFYTFQVDFSADVKSLGLESGAALVDSDKPFLLPLFRALNAPENTVNSEK